ncbi:hypothetical protein B0H13DRAFT_1631791 [Mycena leptocephala]|nr:hypothetical protein B0H13DRAFT_1631791 [Mycena leptocephala]
MCTSSSDSRCQTVFYPVEVVCPDANFINPIFDALSYSKAASGILHSYERFLKGVSVYLKEHLYGNTVTSDLWDGISAASGKFPSPVILPV